MYRELHPVYVTESPSAACLFLTLFASPFKVRGRVQLTNGDRLFLIQLYRWFPSVLKTSRVNRHAKRTPFSG